MATATGFTGVPGNNAQSQNLALAASRSGAYDPVDKLRISSPQSMIDTDFEYGTQPTKWESISLQNNRQSCYYIPQTQTPLAITGVTGNGTTTLKIDGTFVIAANSLIYVQNSNDSNANGWWYTAAGGTNTLNVITTNVVASGNQYNAALFLWDQTHLQRTALQPLPQPPQIRTVCLQVRWYTSRIPLAQELLLTALKWC